MIRYILLLIILLNSSVFYSIFFSKRIEETLFISVFSKVVILFLFGIILNLNIGYIFILITNVIYLFYSLYQIFIRKKKVSSFIFTPGLVLIIFLYFLIIWFSNGRLITIWDEFTHWGLAVKNMFISNTLALEESSTVVAKTYLSGTSIFQYFCMKVFGTYNEGVLFLGLNIMFMSMLVPVYKIFKKISDLFRMPIYFVSIIVFFIPIIVYDGIYNVYLALHPDAMLGVASFYLLFSFVTNPNNDLFKWINLSLSFIALIMIKEFGFVLSLIQILILLCFSLFSKESDKREKKSFRIKEMLPILYAIVPAIIIRYLWKIMLGIYVTEAPGYNAGGSIFDVIKVILTWDFNNHKFIVIKNFLNRLLDYQIMGFPLKITFVTGMILFILIMKSSSLFTKNKEKNKCTNTLLITLVIGGIIYAGALCLTYTSYFGTYEGTIIAAYDRYISTYLLFLLLFGMCYYIYSVRNSEKHFQIGLVLLAFFTFSVTNTKYLLELTFNANDSVINTVNMQKPYLDTSNSIKEKISSTDKVYIFTECTETIINWRFRYYLTPIKVNDDRSTFAAQCDSNYTENLVSIEKWKEILTSGNFKYLFVYNFSENFNDKYGSMFSEKKAEPNSLYKIDFSDDKKLFFPLK